MGGPGNEGMSYVIVIVFVVQELKLTRQECRVFIIMIIFISYFWGVQRKWTPLCLMCVKYKEYEGNQ